MKQIHVCICVVLSPLFFTSCANAVNTSSSVKESLNIQNEKIQYEGTVDELNQKDFTRSGTGVLLPREKLIPIN